MAFSFPRLPQKDSSSAAMAPHHPQTHHPFPTAPAHHTHTPRPQPPPFRRRGSTLSSVTSTSTAASTASFSNYTTNPLPPPPLSPEEGGTPGPLVWINGFPGVGKLTIAQWLHRLLGTDRSVILDHQSQLAHSNGGGAAMLPPTPEVEITDPFFALPIASTGGAGAGRGRRGTASLSLPDQISRPENAHKTIIVTSCVLSSPPSSPSSKEGGGQEEEEEDSRRKEGVEAVAISAARQCLATAQASGRLFLPINLLCQEEENMRRVQSLERRYSSSSSIPGVPASPATSSTSRSLSYPSPQSSRDRVNRVGLARTLREGKKLFLFDGVKGMDLNVTDLEAHEAAMDILGFVNAAVESQGQED